MTVPLRAVAVALVLVLASAPSVALGARCPRTTTTDLEDEVMCPVCQTTLAVAGEAPLARRERAFIARMVGECRSKDEIKRALVGQFGPAVLALPSASGFDASVYVLPLVGGCAAAAGVALMLARWRRNGRGGRARPAPAITRADDALLEADLDRIR